VVNLVRGFEHRCAVGALPPLRRGNALLNTLRDAAQPWLRGQLLYRALKRDAGIDTLGKLCAKIGYFETGLVQLVALRKTVRAQ
jgi:hypothetical protein